MTASVATFTFASLAVANFKTNNKMNMDNLKLIQSMFSEENKKRIADSLGVTNEDDFQSDTTLNGYQRQAMSTCMPSCCNVSYMFFNLVGELGEFASKIAKAIRKEQLCIGSRGCNQHQNELNIISTNLSADNRATLDHELLLEAGDILWQLSGLCEVMGWSLEDVAQANLQKLASRQQRGVIDGSGDNR